MPIWKIALVMTLLLGITLIGANGHWVIKYNTKKKRCVSRVEVVVKDVKQDATRWIILFRNYASGQEQEGQQVVEGFHPAVIPGRLYSLYYNPQVPGEQMPLTSDEYFLHSMAILLGVAVATISIGVMAIMHAWPQ